MQPKRLALMGTIAVVAAVVCLAPEPVAGQAPPAASKTKAWTPSKTPWGDPDLQGVWTNHHGVPLERPNDLAGKAALTDQELAALERAAVQNTDRPLPPGQTGTYNSFWL